MTVRSLLVTLVSLLAPSPVVHAQQPLRVGGTGSAVAAMTRLGAAAAAQDLALRVRVLPSLGSTGAIQAVADGVIDLGMIGRPLRDGERALGVVERVVARTPFVFAVGPQVSAASITTEDLVAYYRGTRITWPDGQRVRPVLRPDHDADTEILRAIAPEVSAAMVAASHRAGMILAVTNTECNEILARSPGSVGPTTLLQLRSEAHPLRPLVWNGSTPTLENLAAGRYPLEKTIRLVFRAHPTEPVRRFLAFLASPAGRDLLRDLGALPLDFPPID